MKIESLFDKGDTVWFLWLSGPGWKCYRGEIDSLRWGERYGWDYTMKDDFEQYYGANESDIFYEEVAAIRAAKERNKKESKSRITQPAKIDYKPLLVCGKVEQDGRDVDIHLTYRMSDFLVMDRWRQKRNKKRGTSDAGVFGFIKETLGKAINAQVAKDRERRRKRKNRKEKTKK